MSAAAIKVLAIQLRQIQSQLETILDKPLWETGVLLPADVAGMAARLDTARFAVNMAAIRAESVAGNLTRGPDEFDGDDAIDDHAFAERAKSLPVCATDGKRDPKPDSGDDPRYVGPEYDKYEADERRGA